MTLEGQQSGARILVVDDEDEIRRLIMSELEHDQHQVTGAATLFEVQVIMSSDPPDLVVLDLNLQDGDGLAFCKEARMKGYRGAIIMVTARDTAMDRVIGLEIGADDYLIKPFEPRELRVRVRNLLGRTASGPSSHARYALFSKWRLDRLKRRLIDPGNHLIMLSSAEFRLLSRFIDAPNVVLSRELLLPERRQTVSVDRSLDVQISRLRQKFALAGIGEELILTVRNEGYLFAADVGFE